MEFVKKVGCFKLRRLDFISKMTYNSFENYIERRNYEK